MRNHKWCRGDHATDTAADTVKWCKNEQPKLEETCLGPESTIFEVPGQLHAEIGRLDSTRPPLTIHKDTLVGISHNDPLFDEAASILSNCFPPRGAATIRTFIKNAYETIRDEVETPRKLPPSTHDSGSCPIISASVNLKGLKKLKDRCTEVPHRPMQVKSAVGLG
jgi:hypothetical protein